MPPPPPPPPGPPPPPAPAKAMPQLGGGGGGDRSNLLKDIRGGKALKKVVTNDRSAPVTGAVRKTSPTEPNRFNGGGLATGSATSPAEPPRLPGIGGLFAGGFPQLKKAGDRDQPPRRPAAPPGKSNHTHVLLTNFRLFFCTLFFVGPCRPVPPVI